MNRGRWRRRVGRGWVWTEMDGGQLMNMHRVSRGRAGVNHARVEEIGGSRSAVLPHKGMGAHSMQDAVARYSGHLLLAVYVRRGYICRRTCFHERFWDRGDAVLVCVLRRAVRREQEGGVHGCRCWHEERSGFIGVRFLKLFSQGAEYGSDLPAGNHITSRTWVQLGQPTPWTA